MTKSIDLKKPNMALFIGNARPPEYQSVKDSGLLIGLLHDSHCPIAYPKEGEFAEIITVDSDAEAARAGYSQLAEKYSIVAQLAAVETAVYDNAVLAQTTGLAAPSVQAATVALNKPLMRNMFISQLGSASTSASVIARNVEDLEQFAASHGYPIILKPTNLFGSMFVTKSSSPDELSKNFAWMTTEIRAHLNANGRKDDDVEIQAETYLDGTSHSVDCVVDGTGKPYPTEIVDVLTERDFGDDRVQHYARYAPSQLSLKQQLECREFAASAVRALGLTFCVAHVEFILTEKGPRLLEIAARPGGNRVHLMREVFGIDVMRAYLSSLTGEKIEVSAQYTKPWAIISVYPGTSGPFVGISNETMIQELAGYVRHGVRVKQGDHVGPASDGHLPVLSIELACSSLSELREAIVAARVACALVEVASTK